MQKSSAIARARVAFLSGAAVLALGSIAQAQETVETVVVTGTLIPRPDYTMPSPVISVGSQEIQHAGTTNLTDYLQRIPALVGSYNNYATTGYNTPASDSGASLAGLNLLNLRNLGVNRTLVLIDGKRQVAESEGSSAVDINSIPVTLIDRVEVATGGSSATYGADAVSGVVNFIMKHDLEGVHAHAQVGASEDGGGDAGLFAVSAGWNFDNDRGNVTVTDEFGYTQRLNFRQRDFANTGGFYAFVPNPKDPADDPHKPDFIPVNNANFIWSAPTGAIDTDLAAFFNPGTRFGPDFTGNGNKYVIGTEFDLFDSVGGSGMPYAVDLHGDFLPQETRNVAQVGAHYDFADTFKVSAEVKWAHVASDSRSTPAYDDFTAVFADNAFLPANVAAAIAANGTDGSFAGHPSAFGLLGEDYLQLTRDEKTVRDTYRAVLSASGDIPSSGTISGLHYDLSYVFGRTHATDQDRNNRVEDRFFASLDSVIDPGTGKATCRTNLDPSAVPVDINSSIFGTPGYSDISQFNPAKFPLTFTPGKNSGCVPFNPFDPNFDNSKAIAFFTANTVTRADITQNVLRGLLNGTLATDGFFDGPMGFAVGAEYRKEESAAFGDPLAQQFGTTFNPGPQDVAGSFDVKEVFAEISQPILKDRQFAQELSFDAAIRQSSYSTAGDTTTWKLGSVWAPFDELRFRGSYAFAVRAPNIGELFAPTQTLFAFVDDPCDQNFVNSGTGFRIANCKSIFAGLGIPYDPATADLNTGSSIINPTTGNTALAPESARTVTFGAVIQPSDWIPGLSASVDWYRVRIHNAIAAPAAGDVADECVDLSTTVNQFCGFVHRDPTTGRLKSVETQQINLAEFDTQGQDFTIAYHFDTADFMDNGIGAFDLHLIGNHLDTLGNVPAPGEARVDNTGYIGPKWQSSLDVAWSLGDWDVDYNIDWYSHTLRYDLQTNASQPDTVAPQYKYFKERWVNNAQVGYRVSDEWRVYAGVNNLFYEKPGIGATGYPVDPVGRLFYLGANLDMDWDRF